MLDVNRLTKTFSRARGEERDRVLAVDEVTFSVGEGQMFTMLGPSGCGKTTTLRCIAGLEQPDSGEIVVAGRPLFRSEENLRIPANERGLGMVFQSYAIWPHMDVFNNVAFPLQVGPRKGRASRAEVKERVMRVLDIMRLGDLATRAATDLSGGQQQRLALARALVLEPPLLLLDEPLSNLDAKLREAMRFELKRLQEELGITSIYVTHDQAEALAMSDVVAVMNQGVFEQVGTPREVYEDPQSYFVADFIGLSNFFEVTVEERLDGSRFRVRSADGELVAKSVRDFSPGDVAVVGIRPEYVEVVAEGRPTSEDEVSWHGKVVADAFQGETLSLIVETVAGTEVRVHARPSLRFAAGDTIRLTLPDENCYLVASS